MSAHISFDLVKRIVQAQKPGIPESELITRATLIYNVTLRLLQQGHTTESLVCSVKSKPGDHTVVTHTLGEFQKRQQEVLTLYSHLEGTSWMGHIQTDIEDAAVNSVRDAYQVNLSCSPHRTCDYPFCSIKKELQMCSGCMKAMYCGQEHQLLDWNRHQMTCISIKEMNEQ